MSRSPEQERARRRPWVAALALAAAVSAFPPAETGMAMEQAAPAAAPAATTDDGTAWTVIVHPASPVRTIAVGELERIYRGRRQFWDDGRRILPLNLPGDDPLRASFTAQVLGSDGDELATYWNRQYFQGIDPPVVLQSGAAVRAYVAATPGAIGYIRREDVDDSVAVVELTREP